MLAEGKYPVINYARQMQGQGGGNACECELACAPQPFLNYWKGRRFLHSFFSGTLVLRFGVEPFQVQAQNDALTWNVFALGPGPDSRFCIERPQTLAKDRIFAWGIRMHQKICGLELKRPQFLIGVWWRAGASASCKKNPEKKMAVLNPNILNPTPGKAPSQTLKARILNRSSTNPSPNSRILR